MPNPDQITNAVNNAGKLITLQDKYPVGFAIVLTIVAFFIGSWWGRIDSNDEVARLTVQVEKLQNNQEAILNASLEKNGIIRSKNERIERVEHENTELTTINDTLSKTITQVGETLLKAEVPAVKILNK